MTLSGTAQAWEPMRKCGAGAEAALSPTSRAIIAVPIHVILLDHLQLSAGKRGPR